MGETHHAYVVTRYGDRTIFRALFNNWHTPSAQAYSAIQFMKVYETWKKNKAYMNEAEWSEAYKCAVGIRPANLSYFQDVTNEYLRETDLFNDGCSDGWVLIFIDCVNPLSYKMAEWPWNISMGYRIGASQLRIMSEEDKRIFRDQWLPLGIYMETVKVDLAEWAKSYGVSKTMEKLIYTVNDTFDEDRLNDAMDIIKKSIAF